MTIAEALMVIAAWCGVPTPYRLENKHVNACRVAYTECVGDFTTKDLSTKIVKCAKERQLPE